MHFGQGLNEMLLSSHLGRGSSVEVDKGVRNGDIHYRVNNKDKEKT